MKRLKYSLKVFGISLGTLCAISSQADEFSYPELQLSQSDFGGTGLLQTPTGRMIEAGTFSFATTNNNEYIHYNTSLQIFPWLESTIRLSQVKDVLLSRSTSFSGDNKYTDKGIDVKLRLLKESYWLPETSIGLRDIGGTGLFDSEYIVASKNLGVFDLSLGLGWGYIGNAGNLYGDKALGVDCNRKAFSGDTGTIAPSRWFSGCASVFGGVQYQTPWQPLNLLAEYDANNYLSDFPSTASGISMPQDSKFNVGANYQVKDWFNVRLSYERGNTWTLGFSLKTNFNDIEPISRDNPAPVYQNQASSENAEQTDQVWQAVTDDLVSIAGYQDPSIYANETTLTIVANQTKYRSLETAHERAAIIIANKAPSITEIRIIEAVNNQAMTETRINTAQFAQVMNHEYLGAKIGDSISYLDPSEPEGKLLAYPARTLQYRASPLLQQSFGSSEDFYLFNVGVTGGASFKLNNNIELAGSAYLNLFDSYDKFLYDVPPDGTGLKRVRTLVRQYITNNALRINNLQLTWMDKLSKNFYAQAYGGYLETMFAGAGGEVLYRPLNRSWAVGVDANYVVQRDPASSFGLYSQEQHFDPITSRSYRVQTGTFTGHISAYYQPTWKWLPDTLVKVSAGQYLTEDKGVTVDFSKQFKSGVIAGVFAIKTNLSAQEFGEGSFNKGFYISIPYDLMTIRPRTNRANIAWTPLTRDGGQSLARKYHLYGMSDARNPWYGKAAKQ